MLDVFLRFMGSMRDIFGEFSPKPVSTTATVVEVHPALRGGSGRARLDERARHKIARAAQQAVPQNER